MPLTAKPALFLKKSACLSFSYKLVEEEAGQWQILWQRLPLARSLYIPSMVQKFELET